LEFIEKNLNHPTERPNGFCERGLLKPAHWGFGSEARPSEEEWHRFCSLKLPMHATFTQKVIICMVAGFVAACLIQWGKVFVEGADDALNKGYKHTSPAISLKAKP
jgi:hypothetical protein